MTRSTHQKKLYAMEKTFGEKANQYFFTLTPDTKKELLKVAKKLQVTESFVAEAVIRNGIAKAVAYYKNKGFSSNDNKRFKSVIRYGKAKKHKSLSITESANKLLSLAAQALGESRSEILECAVRGGALVDADEMIRAILDNN